MPERDRDCLSFIKTASIEAVFFCFTEHDACFRLIDILGSGLISSLPVLARFLFLITRPRPSSVPVFFNLK